MKFLKNIWAKIKERFSEYEKLALHFLSAKISKRLEEKEPDPNANVDKKTRYRQNRCKHLKGGRVRPFTGLRDYAVRDHTFINGRREVACLICGKKWMPGYRGWKEALLMLENTSNTRTSSEAISKVYPTRVMPPRGSHSGEEMKAAVRPRNEDEENPIRGRKF